LTKRWLDDVQVAPQFRALLETSGGDSSKPTSNSVAWEAAVAALRMALPTSQLGFGKNDLYRVVPRTLIAAQEDFDFTWRQRKQELWNRWCGSSELAGF